MSEPRTVLLVEVGPRDGLQNESTLVSLDDKRTLIERLVNTGFRRIEVTSFVNPRAIPQLADADDLLPNLTPRPDVEYISLVPNERGYDRAIAAGAATVELFTAATDAFNEANTNCTVAESFTRFGPIVTRASADGVSVRGAVSVAFHCPYTGPVRPGVAIDVAERLLDMGCYEVAIADTIGRATPDETTLLLDEALRRLPADRISLHFHDTTGQAIDNIRVGWDAGISRFDTSVAGLGGCPFAPGAPGNVASEEVVGWFHARGVETGIDPALLAATATWIRSRLSNTR